MVTSIQELQEKLANLQKLPVMGLPLSLPVQQTPQSPVLDKEMIRGFVKEIFDELLASNIPVHEVTAPSLTLQDAICSSLTSEEQTWLCQDSVILAIPEFLTSPEGKELTQLFISTYREHYNANLT